VRACAGTQGVDASGQAPETVLGQEQGAGRGRLSVLGQGAEHVGDVVELERDVLGVEQPLGVGRHVEQRGDGSPFDPRGVLAVGGLRDDVDIGETERYIGG
jgi:hypothetical protein